jgi:hypothetical protein
MSTVGEGYLWPNITIWSDRQRTVLAAQPTHPQGVKPRDWCVSSTASRWNHFLIDALPSCALSHPRAWTRRGPLRWAFASQWSRR